MHVKRVCLLLTAMVMGSWLGGAGMARATLALQRKATAAGFEATSCTYCHGEKLPKKGTLTFNERGKFLTSEKDKKKAKEVDVAWLKDYVEKK